MSSDIRKGLIEAFTNNPDQYLSGESLAELLGCSRTAIWKHIESLRKDGFILEAVRKKGYRIISSPEKIVPDKIFFGLNTMYMGRNIHFEDSVGSTQTIAQKLALEGAEEGTLVIAEEQLGGRGRLERKWQSPKYKGIWMSLILKPNIPIMRAPQLTLLTAVAVVQGIQEVTGVQADIKWPNDLLLHGKKLTGILTEMQADSDRVHSLIIGIGINVNQQLEDFEKDLQSSATSIYLETQKSWDRAELIQGIMLQLEKLYQLYLEKGFYPIKLLWESYSVSLGQKVTANTLNGSIAGLAKGITEDGVLLLEDEQGAMHSIYSADILLET
ncbi:biotin--[acetyl-CoA-carboxylase] ligase [Bacillus circulans]|uniref:biotin--[acetyl-CoA-carboxylase] ligase n=1 Tax=Niallia circulans TaxID=1397 RepID=UPI0013D54BFF|nr:biotin--[acetyl-CoA-carboxylase] ligase [Niallia circulans]NRG27764.1 biotin--[acetyl-CoA-carboxylase] ligase [Niallia circulans]QJX62736.1 biotin--[acetyl-CoA-carboxylase] ligase [Niallia circulans]